MVALEPIKKSLGSDDMAANLKVLKPSRFIPTDRMKRCLGKVKGDLKEAKPVAIAHVIINPDGVCITHSGWDDNQAVRLVGALEWLKSEIMSKMGVYDRSS